MIFLRSLYTVCPKCVCVCLNYVIWANLLDSAQKFIMCPKSTFLVGARNHAKRQWILKSGIFTKKKTGGGIWPTWYLSHYSITPGRYFFYWTDLLVKILGVNRCHLPRSFFQDQRPLCVTYREASHEWSKSAVVNPDAVMIQSTVTKMDFALYSVWELWFTQKAKAPRTSKVAESGVCNVALKSWSFLKFLAKNESCLIGCWTK